MSTTTHRSLARLPIDLFEGLQKSRVWDALDETCDERNGDEHCCRNDATIVSALDLRHRIVTKLGQALIVPFQQDTTANQRRHIQWKKDLSSESFPLPLPPPQQALSGITTVGNFLQLLSPLSLVDILDPLLTYLECCELYRRICQFTAPKSITALAMLHQTTATLCSVVPIASSDASSATITCIPSKTSKSTTVGDNVADVSFPPTPPLQRHWPTGWTTLDTELRGGFRVGSLTEVVGAAGTGKTQLSMQLAVHTILRNNHSHSVSNDPSFDQTWSIGGGGCIFIDTEQKISLSRLNELAAATLTTTSATAQSMEGEMRDGRTAGFHALNLQDVMENISVHSPRSTLDLQLVLKSLEDEILESNAKASETTSNNTQRSGPRCLPIRLLVIDSIAAPLRRGSESTTGNSSAASQAATVVQIAQTLKRLADQFQLVVCVINQVGSVFTVPPAPKDLIPHPSIESHVIADRLPPTTAASTVEAVSIHLTSPPTRAALGTAWHHCVSTRIELHCGPPQQMSCGGRRYALIVKSNLVQNSIAPIPFQIATRGIVDDLMTNKP